MDEFPGLLSRDFGLRPQGKAAPMSASKKGAFGSASGYGSTGGGTAFPDDLLGGGGQWSSARGDDMFFGGEAACPPPPNYASDPFFSMGPTKTGSSPAVDAGFSASMPVYDKPVYDDDDDGDIFSGLPGMKKSSSTSAAMRDHVFTPPAYEDDLLASLGGSRPASRGQSDNGRPAAASDNAFPTYGDEDLLSTLGRPGGRKGSEAATGKTSPSFGDDPLASIGGGRSSGAEKRSESVNLKHSSPPPYEDDFLAGLSGVPKRSTDEGRSSEQHVSGFDELIPGFGGSVPPKQKSAQTQSKQQDSSFSSIKSTVTVDEDPFVFFESTSSKTHSSSGLSSTPSEYRNKPSAKTEILFDDTNNFDDFMKSAPSLSPNLEINKSRTPVETTGKAAAGDPSTKAFGNIFQATASDDRSNQNMFEKPFESSEPYKSGRINSPEINTNDSAYDASSGDNVSHNVEEPNVTDDSIWLTVSEIPLVTRPTSAPPPSRPPPPAFRSKQSPFTSQNKASSGSNSRRKVMESSFPQEGENYHSQNSHTGRPKYAESLLDDLEEFATGMPYGHASEGQPAEEENEANSSAAASAAAMKQAMDRAEAKFKHARGVRERERDMRLPKNKETLQYVTDEDEKEKESLDYEREERERKEKEQRRLEKMRELELEKERERARQAVERATREARERAAADARQRAEKAAREQAERAAVQRAQAEARERAAAEAKERAEKLAAERERERERAETETRERAAREKAAERERAEAAARERAAREKAAVEARGKAERAAVERAASEARARAQRAAVERATAQARERAASEARERAAAMAREKQQKPENDLNSFFGMGSRATSAPKERASPSGSAFDAQNQNNTKTSSVSTSSMRRPSSAVNFMDDLTSVFGTSSNDEFQEIEGEPEERRKARLEREQRARQRVAKALAEKNEREMQVQREQAERDRISDTLNIEIKRWSAGKEGNLRALLSTLQYVLWPDSGWQPVSLTDLITGASVKKVYRKATLCVHPDKVVNGTVQQKYVAEKVFDLLKEAWNKFNSEELF